MNYIQYMKPGNKFWTLPNGQEDVSWSEFWNNWRYAITKAKNQIVDNWENLKQDYKDASDPVAASKRRQAESIEATRAKQASMKFVSDNRSDYEKKRDVKNLELKEFEQKEQQNKDATDAVMWTLTGIPYAVQHLASPNGVVKTYGNTKAAIQNGGGPYIEKAVASAAGDALDAFIIASPIVFNEGRQLARELNKNIKTTTLQPTAADEAVLRGQLGWAPKQTIPYRHGSKQADLKTFVPKYDRWDVTTHGADPYMYFVTDQTTPVSAANMMDLRPYQYTGNIIAEKPMVQVGDFNIAGKNATRNQLISRARQQGADTYLLQDIVDNKVPHQNVVARFIGPEGEAVQGGASNVKWYGPTMGKTTAAQVSDKIVDIDPLLKPIRAKHAERLGLKISDPKVSADPMYKQEVADFVLEWRANPNNQGKTLVASTKHLLAPEYNIQFANQPAIPEFEVFVARNKARGFRETDEQLRAWYNSIFEQNRDLVIDNRFVSTIENGTRAAKISEAERLGIPKDVRNKFFKNSDVTTAWRGTPKSYTPREHSSSMYGVTYLTPSKDIAYGYGMPHLYAFPDNLNLLDIDFNGKPFHSIFEREVIKPTQELKEAFNKAKTQETTDFIKHFFDKYSFNISQKDADLWFDAIHNNSWDDLYQTNDDFLKGVYNKYRKEHTPKEVLSWLGFNKYSVDDALFKNGQMQIKDIPFTHPAFPGAEFNSIDEIGRYIEAHPEFTYDGIKANNVVDFGKEYTQPQTQLMLKKTTPIVFVKKSGGVIHTQYKNKGKFAKIRDYVDYKNNK